MTKLQENEYSRGWVDYKYRINRVEVTRQFFQSERLDNTIDYGNIRNVLSVGPGEGDLDLAFLSLCPALEQYTGVEPNTSRCQQLRAALNTQFPNIKVNIIDKGFQEFDSADKTYDVTLFFHSLYFWMDSPIIALEKAFSIMKPGGKVIVLMDHQFRLTNTEPVWGFAKRLFSKVRSMPYQIHEEVVIPATRVDLAHSGDGYYDFLDLLAGKQLSRDEKNERLKRLHGSVIPGTEQVEVEQIMFIITM